MNIKVWNYENKEEVLLEFKARKNAKSIIELIKKELQTKYNCSIRNVLVQGKIDYLNSENTELHYILFGNNLPCRTISYILYN